MDNNECIFCLNKLDDSIDKLIYIGIGIDNINKCKCKNIIIHFKCYNEWIKRKTK